MHTHGFEELSVLAQKFQYSHITKSIYLIVWSVDADAVIVYCTLLNVEEHGRSLYTSEVDAGSS